MKNVCIFGEEKSENGIWSVAFEYAEQNEFDLFFDRMHDVGWLYNFFVENEPDLQSGFYGHLSVSGAVEKTLKEVAGMEDALYSFAEAGFRGKGNGLQQLFRPLHNYEYSIVPLQLSKARVYRGWLRLYAIRLAANCYLITGGAIKLTRDMQAPHLQWELKKLDLAKRYLHLNGITFPEDLNQYYDD